MNARWDQGVFLTRTLRTAPELKRIGFEGRSARVSWQDSVVLCDVVLGQIFSTVYFTAIIGSFKHCQLLIL
jgi:hypothetical protein